MLVRLGRVLNLTSRVSIQESVKQMEAAEGNVLALKSLVDSESQLIEKG